jgi:signal transduction histidine kinase
MLKALITLLWICLQFNAGYAQNLATPLEQPMAFCVAPLSDCTPDKFQPVTTALGYDIRPLNGGHNDPITLVYAVPPTHIGQNNVALLVSPSFRDHCFQLDSQRSQTVCSRRELLTLPLAPDTRYILTQNVQGDDIRLVMPNLLIGSAQELHAHVLESRTPVLVLAGWYAFLAFAAFFQLLTPRNRFASFCVGMLAVGMFCRTIISSHFGFADLTLLDSFIDRRLGALITALLGVFFVGFYGVLIGKRLLRLRLALMGLFVLAGLFSWFAPQQHVNHSLQFVQLTALLGIIFSSVCVVLALKLLQLREQLVLLAGVSVLFFGFIADLVMAVNGLPLLMGGTGLASYCFAFETLCQFILIALRNDTAHQEAQRYQTEQLATQALLVQSLKDSESLLNDKVEQRTAELKTANTQIASALIDAEAAKDLAQTAQHQAETQRQQAEAARFQTEHALNELKATQTQLIAAEKMASLGLLVSNVAHEINTPIGAVKSSGALIADTLESTLADMPQLFSLLDAAPRDLFVQLALGKRDIVQTFSTREERAITKQIAAQLEDAGVDDTHRKARLLMKLRAHQNPLDYLPLLQHPESEFILSVASNIADVVNSTHNINSAVEKVSRVVYALKALSGDDIARAVTHAPLQPDMDKALAKYQNQMQHVELVKNFQADMLPIHADHDAMEQLCIHLVMNALQAMNYQGKLSVGLKAENKQAIITVADTGTGIADAIKGRIFEPFFTTRTSGEGSGMGLAIVKRIVEQHQGSIDVETEVGAGTAMTVHLPIKFDTAYT